MQWYIRDWFIVVAFIGSMLEGCGPVWEYLYTIFSLWIAFFAYDVPPIT